MVAYEPHVLRERSGHGSSLEEGGALDAPRPDISTMVTEVNGVRVFDTWGDDLDMSLDQVTEVPKPLVAPLPLPRPKRRGRTLAIVLVCGALGALLVGGGLLALVAVGGVAALGALLWWVPMVDVQLPSPADPAAIVAPADDVDANLVVMPDPGFRGAPDEQPERKGGRKGHR